jgi:trk system potassium uptake protein
MRVIIFGGDKITYSLARQFSRKKYHVTIIDDDPGRAHELAHTTNATVVLGDGTNVTTLEDAGARRADAVIALTPHDQDNLICCQIADRTFGVPRTIALVNDPENEVIFKKLGVKVAFSATRIIAAIIDQETDFESITSLMPLAQGRLNVTDIRLHRNAPAVGQTLAELELSENSLVACIIRGESVLVARGSTRFLPNDHVVLISQPENQVRDIEILVGPGTHP